MRRHLLNLTPGDLRTELERLGQPPYRAGQILKWMFHRNATAFDDMSDLPGSLRQELAAGFRLSTMTAAALRRSEKDGAAKYLFELSDGERVESVYIPEQRRRTVCISSQVGCAMGCVFCATAQMGFARDLTGGEIIEQVLAVGRDQKGISNVVFMGMGEPLLNLDAAVQAVSAFADPERMGISPRRVTISTCGIVPGIQELASRNLGVGLAVSIGSPFDEERTELMPVNRRYPLPQLIHACEEFARHAKRRLTIEYVVLADVNDSAQHARALGRMARRLGAKINLIAHNPVTGCAYRAPGAHVMRRFRAEARKPGAQAVIRFRRGRDIQAACGQLRAAGPPESTHEPR